MWCLAPSHSQVPQCHGPSASEVQYECPYCRSLRRDLKDFKQDLDFARQEVTKKLLDRKVKITGADITALWTGRVDMLLVELFSMALRGAQTCKFALCVGGSLARK